MRSCVRVRSLLRCAALLLTGVAIASGFPRGASADLRSLPPQVIPEADRAAVANTVRDDLERVRKQATARENAAWNQVKTVADWEKFRDVRIAALKRSLGRFPAPPAKMDVTVTKRIEDQGATIECLVYETRPGLLVTANLYRPSPAKAGAPGIVVSHSHHNPKTQSELQDMGLLWARSGAVVLVPDLVGHGERRQHPFASASDWPKEFRPSRQDYYFRYDTGMQLQLVGESLMGWNAWDLMRGVDVLVQHAHCDAGRIVLIGAVAGGGDPAGVTAALDPRIAVVAPFNFGGVQPDYAIPEDAENDFYYFGVPYWETTRALRLGGRDGFAHWTIVASVAPRGVIHSYEFDISSLLPRDPAWKRLQHVFALYGKSDRLGIAEGKGNLKGRPPEHTHCNNVGEIHRKGIHPLLEKWLGMPVPQEYANRRESQELLCLTPQLRERMQSGTVARLADELAGTRSEEARAGRAKRSASERTAALRSAYAELLGRTGTVSAAKVVSSTKETIADPAAVVERVRLESEPGIAVPTLLISPNEPTTKTPKRPVVVWLTDSGKQRVLAERSAALADLLKAGVAVCLPDVRGTGESGIGAGGGPNSSLAGHGSKAEIYGKPILGGKLHDLRSVLGWLRTRSDVDAARIAVCGEGLAPTNPDDMPSVAPRGTDIPNKQAESTSGLLAILAGTFEFENDLAAVTAIGTFDSFRSLLVGPMLHVPYDSIVPGALERGDVLDLIAAQPARPVRLASCVDGANRRVSAERAATRLAVLKQRPGFEIDGAEDPQGTRTAAWLAAKLKAK